MIFRHTKNGWRVRNQPGDSPLGVINLTMLAPQGMFRIVDDQGQQIGVIEVDLHEPAPPPPPTADQETMAAQRARTCSDCDQNHGVTIRDVELSGKTSYVRSVSCAACGCGGLSLIGGSCPLGRWK